MNEEVLAAQCATALQHAYGRPNARLRQHLALILLKLTKSLARGFDALEIRFSQDRLYMPVAANRRPPRR
jgi:hypothetical protein